MAGMNKVVLLGMFSVVAAIISPEEADQQLASCTKHLNKFMLTRLCVQQELANVCLNIDTPYVTQVLDYCYKELNYDPIDLRGTLEYVCNYEETILEVAGCFCKAMELIEESEDYPEAVENQLSENEDYEYGSEPYNSTMMTCLHYMNAIYYKGLRRHHIS